jgi:hypothetical protein
MERLDVLHWLLDRTDRIRASHAARAYNVLTADAALLAAVVFLLKELDLSTHLGETIFGILLFAAACLFASLMYAVYASSGSLRRPGVHSDPSGPPRTFLNPAATASSFQSHNELLTAQTEEDFIASGSHELFVLLKLQGQRYENLKRASRLLLVGALLLLVSLPVAVLLRPSKEPTSVAPGQKAEQPVPPGQKAEQPVPKEPPDAGKK